MKNTNRRKEMTRKNLKVGAAWALAAFASAAAAHFAECPEKGQAWFQAIENVRPLVEAHDRLMTLKELKKLPTWSLQAIAKAAAEQPFQTRRYKVIAAGLMTEFERRRAKATDLAKEGV